MSKPPSDSDLSAAEESDSPLIPNSVTVAARLLILVLVCAILFWGQVILMPMALALLLSFVLYPIIRGLERRGLHRLVGVLLVLTGIGAIVGAVGWMVAVQLADLGRQLPSYRQNIVKKVADVRDMMSGGVLEKLQLTVEEVVEEVEADERREEAENPERRSRSQDEPDPITVKVARENQFLGMNVSSALFPALNPIVTFGFVLILAIFMLLKREDLRNRAVSFAGRERLVSTTRALNEAGQRISRFLVAQLCLNAGYGIIAGIGLHLLGVPYAILWGLCTALLRYIPYVGPWIGALMPITVTLITSSGWQAPLGVIGLFIVLELICNNVAEPYFYGRSVGISEVAILISAVGWAWLWGPVGLILATPLSICIVVVGQHVKGLRFFSRLMSDDQALKTELQFYHRLVCRDRDEATQIAEKVIKENGWEEMVDNLLLPALIYGSQDFHAQVLSDEEVAFIGDFIDELAERFGPPSKADDAKPFVLVCPPRNGLDAAIIKLAANMIEADGHCRIQIMDPMLLSSEVAAKVNDTNPIAVLVAILPPAGVPYLRRWCKLLGMRCPQVEIVAARWELTPHARGKPMERYGADEGVTRFETLRSWIHSHALLHHTETAELARRAETPSPAPSIA